MISDSATRMQPTLGFDVGGVSLFGSVKHAEMLSNTLVSNVGEPAFRLVVPIRASEAGSEAIAASPLDVLSVDCDGNVPKVVGAVVLGVAVNVIHDAARMRTVDEEPNKPVREMTYAVDHDVAIAKRVDVSSNIAFLRGSAAVNEPDELAGFRAVGQKFSQTLRGKIVRSHEALQLLIGQRPARDSHSLRASLFSLGV